MSTTSTRLGDRPCRATGAARLTALTYRAAGVDIEAGEEAVRLIKKDVESTYIPGVLGSLGGFAGLFELPKGLEDPVLVTATDGVGTKILLAQETGALDTVGIDLVAMSVNDVLTVGARPLLFLDYVAVGRLMPAEMAQIVAGVAEGCRQAGCALIGGEMAEMPGLYAPGEFDLAGFCVAMAERKKLIDGSASRRATSYRVGVERPALQRLLAGAQGAGDERRRLERQVPCVGRDHRPGRPARRPRASTCGACSACWTRAFPCGHGPHHRRRHRGQPVAGHPGRAVGPAGLPRVAVPPVFRALQDWAASPTRRCSAPSIWGSASCWWCRAKPSTQALGLLTEAGEQAVTGGRGVTGRGRAKVTLEGLQ